MTTNTTNPVSPADAGRSQPRRTRTPGLLALIVAAGAGVYVGTRWHAAFERWLFPTSGSAVSASEPKAPPTDGGHKQLWTCGMHPQVMQDHPGDCPICHMKLTPLAAGDAAPGGVAPSGGPGPSGGAVLIDPAVVQNMGVRTVLATRAPLTQRVRATAAIVEPESARIDINLRVSGWIQTLHADTDGMTIHKGDPLFELDSPDLRLAIEELIAARRAGAESPPDGGAPLRVAGESLVAAAELRLRTLGLAPGQIEQLGAMQHAPATVTFTAPADGIVVDKANVHRGSSVTAGQLVLRLADRSTMWVECRVPEGSLGRVRVGQHAAITVGALPGPALAGDVVFIHPTLDESTRTALVRVAVPNPDGALRAGMFAVAAIDAGSSDPTTIVPREAVIDSGESQVLFVSMGKGRFEPRRVSVGASGDGGLVQILSGVEPGETVVASGQFLLDSESRLREAVAKFLGQSPAPPAPSPGASGPAPAPAPDAKAPAPLVDRVVAEYLAIAEPLGQEQSDTPPAGVDGLLTALDALIEKAEGADAKRLGNEARRSAAALRSQSSDKQRELLKPVSAAVIALVDAMPPSDAVSASLYVAYCPMANADWLQRSEDLANPYFAEDMKLCGSIVRRIGQKPADPKRGAP